MLDEEVTSLLRALGLEPRGAHPITALPYRDASRATWRVDLADGGRVKARRLVREAKGRRIVHMLELLADPRLPRVLAHRGRHLVEAWVDGTSLAELTLTGARLDSAADLLGSLHARLPACLEPVHRAARTARARLGGLALAGALTVAEANELARARPPARARVGIVHGDYCAENLIEDPVGGLHAIDNELVRRDFLDLDLARVWYRWPMSAQAWDRFVTRRARWLPDEPDPRTVRFWRIVATAKAAHLRLARRGDLTGPPIDRLRALLGEGPAQRRHDGEETLTSSPPVCANAP